MNVGVIFIRFHHLLELGVNSVQIFVNQNSFVFTQYSARSSISATRHLQII